MAAPPGKVISPGHGDGKVAGLLGDQLLVHLLRFLIPPGVGELLGFSQGLSLRLAGKPEIKDYYQ